mmetsp:Transcript_50872/g.110509  ORF Transcript_50872/g.110509 Transcript_50872/m.110509 type:complete len:269 (+) Transcript_50872:773-1579(+)
MRASHGIWSCSSMKSCSTICAHSMSLVLNSYRMFHPNGPYLRRSCNTAWKKHRPQNSFFQSLGFLLDSYLSSPRSRIDRVTLARMPRGGSLVSLIPFCSTATGNVLAGIEVSQRRKSALISEDTALNPSMTFSIAPIQLVARWQFMRHTQSPRLLALDMSFSAMGPCPCPREMTCSLSPYSFSSAKRNKDEVGSAPVDRTKMIGVTQLVSLYTSERVKGGDSVYLIPMESRMKLTMANMSFSCRNTRRGSSFWNGVNSSSYGAGRLVS